MSIRSTTPPDEERLQALIAEAYEVSPAPDAWRLKDVEERLSRRLARAPRSSTRPSLWPWWLAAALLAGSAAAWWAYEVTRSAPEIKQEAPAIRQHAPADASAPAESEGRREQSRTGVKREQPPANAPVERRSPLIYQRETH